MSCHVLPGLIEVLFSTDDAPLVGDVVAQHSGIGKVRLNMKLEACNCFPDPTKFPGLFSNCVMYT